MDPFDDGGTFWLPETPDHQVSGHLSFNGEAFLLLTDSSLVHVEMPEDEEVPHTLERVVHSVIVGTLRRLGDVTLLNADGVPSQPFYGDDSEEWSASVALLGAHVVEPIFASASFTFDVLVAWAQPPSLVTWDTPGVGQIDLMSVELGRAVVNGATVRLTADWTGQAGGELLDVRRRCWLRVDLPALRLNDLLDQWVLPMQDLLIVLLGRSVRLTDLAVVPDSSPLDQAAPEDRRRRGESVRVVLGGLMAAPGVEASWASLRNWGTPTMFVREDLPVDYNKLITGWFAAREALSEAVTLLCSPFYAPFMYSEHRYAATFQSAESIARVRYSGQELAKQEHRTRVAAIVEAARAGNVPDHDVAWAERVLRSRNDRTLAQLIEALLADVGVLGEQLLARDPAFATTAASARARVSHPGGEGLTTIQRYWYGQALLWVVRAKLAAEAGIPLDALTDRILKGGHFSQTLEKLQTSVSE